MTGHWAIVRMDDFDESYFGLGDQPPHVTITYRARTLGAASTPSDFRRAAWMAPCVSSAERPSSSSDTRVWTRWIRSKAPAGPA